MAEIKIKKASEKRYDWSHEEWALDLSFETSDEFEEWLNKETKYYIRANAGFYGNLLAADTDAAGQFNWGALPGVSDTITYNGTSTGGKIYDRIKFTDIATDKWLVEGYISQSGGSEATPFSSAA